MSVRWPSSRVVAALAAVLVVTAVPRAWAQEPAAPKHSDDPAAAEARRHYEEGTKAFNLGEFPRAIAEFKAAYNAKDDPSLLYNIAQSFRLQGDAAQAIFFYRSFLRNMPTALNRREVEGRIRALEKQVEDQKKEEQQKKESAAPLPLTPLPPVASPAAAPAPPAEPPPATATVPAAPLPAAEAAPAAQPLPVAPAPVEPAPAAPAVDLTHAPAEQPASQPSHFYKKWWFWTAVGVVAVIGVGAGIAAARDKPPSTSLGLYDPMFKP